MQQCESEGQEGLAKVATAASCGGLEAQEVFMINGGTVVEFSLLGAHVRGVWAVLQIAIGLCMVQGAQVSVGWSFRAGHLEESKHGLPRTATAKWGNSWLLWPWGGEVLLQGRAALGQQKSRGTR